MIPMHKTLFLVIGALACIALPRIASADPCWDKRGTLVDENGQPHDFPFSNRFGALPPEVKRCETTALTVMEALAKVRADPSLLETEKKTGHVYYKSLLWCCEKWLGYRCKHYPPPPNNPEGYGDTRLEGQLCPPVNPVDKLGVKELPKPVKPVDKQGVFEKPGTGIGDVLKGKP